MIARRPKPSPCPTCSQLCTTWEPDRRLRAGGLWRCRACRSQAQQRWRWKSPPGRIDGRDHQQWRAVLFSYAFYAASKSLLSDAIVTRIDAIRHDYTVPVATLATLGRLMERHRWTAVRRWILKLRPTPRRVADRSPTPDLERFTEVVKSGLL